MPVYRNQTKCGPAGDSWFVMPWVRSNPLEYSPESHGAAAQLFVGGFEAQTASRPANRRMPRNAVCMHRAKSRFCVRDSLRFAGRSTCSSRSGIAAAMQDWPPCGLADLGARRVRAGVVPATFFLIDGGRIVS